VSALLFPNIFKNFGGKFMVSTECESCWHYDYDEEFEEYYCMMDLDEDEVYRIMTSKSQHCPYYRQGDDYTLARRQ
jgi:hypothetical protein